MPYYSSRRERDPNRVYADKGLRKDTITIINNYNRGKNNPDIES